MDASYPVLPAPWEIPVDYKITKSPFPLSSRDLTVYDARGSLAYRAIDGRDSSTSSRTPTRVMTLFDASAVPLLTVIYDHGEWRGFRDKEEIFTANNLYNSKFRTKIDVYLSEKKFEDPRPSYRLMGNPFRRACTITRQDSLVAQTNLLYKLKTVIYWRRKFRLTLYPRNDQVLVLAMLVTFFWNYS